MTPTEAVAAALARLAEHRVVLLDDPLGLVDLPARVPRGTGSAWQVVIARGNLDFRRRYEPLRAEPVIVVRRRPGIFLPDVEAESGWRCRLTPRRLLALATGRDDWPTWVDQEGELVRECFEAIVRARRQVAGELTAEAVEALLIEAATGLDLDHPPDVADAWAAIFRHERRLRRLHKRGSRLAKRLQAWLRRQLAPLAWLDLDDPTAAVRLTWMVALLQPHLPDLVEQLPRLYPGAQPLDGKDATAVARVAYRLERLDPELAAAQRDTGEAVLEGPLRDPVVKLLRLTTPEGAVATLRREPRSGHLCLMALRSLLQAVATDAAPHGLRLEPELEHLAARAERYSHAAAVREHALLLRSLLRLDRVRARLTDALSAPADDDLARLPAVFADSGAGYLDDDARLARRALTGNLFAETGWDPVPAAERHKQVGTALYHLVRLSEQRLHDLERRFAAALVATGDDAGPRVERAFDDLIEPLREARGHPRTCLVLVSGLSWSGWEQAVAPAVGRSYDVETKVLTAPLPATGAWSLRRAVGGMRWRAEHAELGPDALVAALRPELALHRGRPSKAFEPLRERGLIAFSYTSRGFCLLGVDLLAGEPYGVPVTDYQARLALFGRCLAAQARSGRRDELVAVMATSGAVACADAPGASLGGPAYGARCVARLADDEVEGGWRLPDGPRLADGMALWAASGRGRLVPAPADRAVADGGMSLSETALPLALLTPVPRGERSTLTVSHLAVNEWLTAGQPAALTVWLSLTAGALAEVATVTTNLGGEPVTVTLDLNEQRAVTVDFVPALPAGARRLDTTVEATVTVGRRRYVRRALTTIVAPPAEPAEAPDRARPPVGENHGLHANAREP